MARTNGLGTDTGSRKKLVKPALPALPLLSKLKKDSPKIKEEENQHLPVESLQSAPQLSVEPEQVNESNTQTTQPAANEAPLAGLSTEKAEPELTVNTEPEAHPRSTTPEKTVNSGEDKKQQLLPPSVTDLKFDESTPSDSVQDEPVLNTAPHAYDVPQISPAREDQLPTTNGDTIHANSGEGSEDDHTSIAVQELATSPIGEPETIGSAKYNLNEPLAEKAQGFIAETPMVLQSDSGHDAMKSVVPTYHSAHHSTHTSVSTSSMQQMPVDSFVVQSSFEPVRSSQPRTVIKNASYNTPQPVLNGHLSPASNGNMVSPPGLSNFPTILDHIHRILYSQECIDCEVCVYLPHEPKPTIYRNAHSFVLIRSARLRNIIHQQRANGYYYYSINLSSSVAIDTNAFDAALRFFYDDTVLSVESVFRPNTLVDKASRAGALQYIMSYMIAGLELGIDPVIAQSLGFVGRLMDWDIAELAIKSATMLRAASVPAVNPHAPQEAVHAAKTVINHVFSLIVLRLDMKHFRLDVDAVPLDLTSRLAPFDNGKAAVNPALASMVFGSMPASTNMSPTSPQAFSAPIMTRAETIASSIMLNVDFEDLRDLTLWLKKIHGVDGMRVMNEVVEERERRRLSIFGNRSTSNKQRMANSTAWDIIGMREYVNEDALRRERVGFLLPGKRGGFN